jgi:hypothetical protein
MLPLTAPADRGTGEPQPGVRLLFAWPSAVFGVAAAALAVARGLEAFEHGWWLVTYLALVGALAQLILGAGRIELSLSHVRGQVCRRVPLTEAVVWNLGTILVPIGVLTGTKEHIVAGSLLLLGVLWLVATKALSDPPRDLCLPGLRSIHGRERHCRQRPGRGAAVAVAVPARERVARGG